MDTMHDNKWIADDKYIMRDGQQIGSFITAELALEAVVALNERERLREALRACHFELLTMIPRVTPRYRDSLQRTADFAKQALNEQKGE